MLPRCESAKYLPDAEVPDRLKVMITQLSPQNEQFLASVVAGGLFASQEAALAAAIDALREKIEPIPYVPGEHMERVEQGMADARAGRKRELTDADWERLRQPTLRAANENQPDEH